MNLAYERAQKLYFSAIAMSKFNESTCIALRDAMMCGAQFMIKELTRITKANDSKVLEDKEKKWREKDAKIN